MEQEIAQAIAAAGDNPRLLALVAQQYGLDPAFVASVASGTGRTSMAQAFDPSLLVAAGIISPEVLSSGLAQAGETAFQDALREYQEDRSRLAGQAPQFVSAIEYSYGNRFGQDHPIMNFFADIRNGRGVTEVLNQAVTPQEGQENSVKEDMIVGGLMTEDEWTTLGENLKDYATDVARFNQENYEFMLANDPNSPQYQANMASLGAMPTRETFDTSQARLDYAKALGMPALALLPDPAQQAYVDPSEVRQALGGDKVYEAMQEIVQGFVDRGKKELPDLPRTPLVDVDARRVGLTSSRPMDTADFAGQQAKRARQQKIIDEDKAIAGEQAVELAQGLAVVESMLASKKPNPFSQALQQYGIFGALEANA